MWTETLSQLIWVEALNCELWKYTRLKHFSLKCTKVSYASVIIWWKVTDVYRNSQYVKQPLTKVLYNVKKLFHFCTQNIDHSLVCFFLQEFLVCFPSNINASSRETIKRKMCIFKFGAAHLSVKHTGKHWLLRVIQLFN